MLVTSLHSKKGNAVPNQYCINKDNAIYFQSYQSIIAKVQGGLVELDSVYWNYSRTTSKYLSIFLNESTKDIKEKIKKGIYKLTNLN